MKILFLLVCSAAIGGTSAFEDEMQCNLKTCVLDLINFNDLGFGALIRKIQTAVFCIRECSPPVVHEFFQSISFVFSKKIPGKCRGMECAEHNRFIALSQCVKREAWPLLQCGKILFDLMQLPFEPVDPVNTTCSIVIETGQCIEETLSRCGEKTFSLVKEIMSKPLKLGIKAFCRPSHSYQARNLLTTDFSFLDLRNEAVTINHEPKMAPAAKALRRRDGENSSKKLSVPFLSVFACLTIAISSSYF